MNNKEELGFPLQKIPYKNKTKSWRQSCVRHIVSCAESNTGSDGISKQDMQAHYDLYNGVFDEKRLRYVTNPWKQDDGFPATAQNLNIIKPQVDLLCGEMAAKPFNFTVVRTSETVTTEYQDKMREMLTDYMVSAMYANMSEEDALIHQEKLQSGEIQLPEQIQSYFEKSYKDVGESIADKALKYLNKKLNIQKTTDAAYFDVLASAKEVYYIGERAGEPVFERVNPMLFAYDYSPDIEYIHEASWCARQFRTSVQEIYNKFYDKMDESMLDKLLNKLNAGSLGKTKKQGDNSGVKYVDNLKDFLSGEATKDGSVDLWHVCWQSYKKVGFVTLIDENGELEEFQVDESYYVTGDEVDIKWEWGLETWEGYWIDDEINFGIKPIDYQYITGNSYNSSRLPYTGAVYHNANTKPRSFISFLEPLQYIYIMLWYRLELALARDKGKVINMDITQIPKSMNIDVPKWMHYLSAMGVNLINPYDEGWDVQGRGGGRAAQYNNFHAVDLSMSNTIGTYIELLDKVETMAESLTGITPQRKGAIQQKELVGNVERSIMQSSNITEGLNSKHNYVVQEALNMLLNVAKHCWANNNPESLSYILDDGERVFLSITDDFLFEDFDVFVSNSRDDLAKLEQLKSLFQPAMQNGATLSDIAEIMSIGNISKIKEHLRKIENERREREEQAMEAERENQLKIEEMRREALEMELADKEADRENDRYLAEINNAAKIAMAQINVYRYQQDLDQNNNGVPDPVEIGKLALDQQDKLSAQQDRQLERDLKRKEIESKYKLEREKLKSAEKLQKQKDTAAMEREKLKAKTALKNKVVGEK